VEGKISLSGYRVTIGSTGQVTAEIVAKSVVVGGQVKGSIRAEERVEVSASGNLLGDVRSPRVILADGAKFKGSVDMDAGPSSSSSSAGAPSGGRGVRDPLLTPDETSLYGSGSGS
jgi:cytoskeletal protein CcmA (bactofilin family)